MMRFHTIAASAALAIGLAGGLCAQSYSLDKVPPPMNANDSFDLDLQNPVVVGKRVLPPGRYRFEPVDIAGGDLPVLSIRSQDSTEKPLYIAATISPTYREFAPAETSATFYHIGERYYFDRIYVRGLNYGFRFELPKSVKKEEAAGSHQ